MLYSVVLTLPFSELIDAVVGVGVGDGMGVSVRADVGSGLVSVTAWRCQSGPGSATVQARPSEPMWGRWWSAPGLGLVSVSVAAPLLV